MPKFGSQIDTSKIPVKGLIPEASGSSLSSPGDGQLWTDTSATPRMVKFWNGSSWVKVDGSDIPDGTITDAKVAAGAAIALSKLAVNPLARANHTGTQLAATISDFDTQVRTSRLDQMAAPTASVSLNSQKITNLLTPSSGSDAATKAYVDDARTGITGVKDPVRVATQSNVNLSSAPAAIDGVTLTTGDRFLAAGQSTGTQNGIYTYQGSGAAATRAADADATGEILDGTILAVAEGTYAGNQYIQTAAPSGSPGSWTQTWTVYTTSGTTYLAGAGQVLSGNTFNIVAADGSIVVNADDITVGNVPISKGGTGGTTAATARANLAAVTAYDADAPALSAGTPSNVTHNLGTQRVSVTTWENTGGAEVKLDVALVDNNTISLKSDIAYGSGTLRVVVHAKG